MLSHNYFAVNTWRWEGFLSHSLSPLFMRIFSLFFFVIVDFLFCLKLLHQFNVGRLILDSCAKSTINIDYGIFNVRKGNGADRKHRTTEKKYTNIVKSVQQSVEPHKLFSNIVIHNFFQIQMTFAVGLYSKDSLYKASDNIHIHEVDTY